MNTRNPNLDLYQHHTTARSEAWRSNLGKTEVVWPRPDSWWTGLNPRYDCPGRSFNGTLTSLPTPHLTTCSREEVFHYFVNTWALTETLFSCLVNEEAFYRPPYHNLRHPLIFYYTHPAVLYVNKLRVAGLLKEPVNQWFESLFETGVDEMSWDDLSKNEMEWPPLSECYEYRKTVFRIVSSLIMEHPSLAEGHAPIDQKNELWALFLGFEHERIHLETSSVLMRELPLELVRRSAEFPPLYPAQPKEGQVPQWLPPGRTSVVDVTAIQAGVVQIGKPDPFPAFGWDNEYGQRITEVPAFETSTTLITNEQFYTFVLDGGYRDESLWTKEGWSWRSFRNVKWPTFWVPIGPQGSHQYALRTLFEVISMPWNWPVVVNFHEAKAFAAWLNHAEGRTSDGWRLPSEAEHHRLRQFRGFSDPQKTPSYEEYITLLAEEKVNINLRWGSESPVVAERTLPDVCGNVWHWLEDHFNPLPGFRVHPYYDDFSLPCFDGKHQMIVGGSYISTGAEATLQARFHFRPHFYQHAGFRLVRGGGETAAYIKENSRSPREERIILKLASEQVRVTPCTIDVTNCFSEKLAEILVEACETFSVEVKRVLLVGSGPGVLLGTLATSFPNAQITGAEVAEDVVAASRSVLSAEGYSGTAFSEQENPHRFELRYAEATRARITVRHTDASCLPAEWYDFDIVVLCGVLSQMPCPGGLLGRLGGARGLLRQGGILCVAETWDWQSAVTPPELWLRGVADSPVILRDYISNGTDLPFNLLKSQDITRVTPYSRRTLEVKTFQVSVWSRPR